MPSNGSNCVMASNLQLAIDMNTLNALGLLDGMLKARLCEAHYDWLQQRLSVAINDDNLRDFHIGFGLIPRRIGRGDLSPSASESLQADEALSGWVLNDWSVDMAARILLLCTLAQKTNHDFGELFKSMCQTADLGESISLYTGCALYPPGELLDKQIGEGLRTHIRAVFEAIAHNNPYPAAHFSELRWNHMVLKALFIDSTLHPVQGLDARANPELARILCDYAHERWAARRPVTPELWRCVGPFACGNMLDDLQRALDSPEPFSHQAAVLALTVCNDPQASTILATCPADIEDVAKGRLSWDSINSDLNLVHKAVSLNALLQTQSDTEGTRT